MTKQPTTLGAFSVSLAVKDLQASREFYEKLGFEAAGGDPEQHWLILRNGTVQGPVALNARARTSWLLDRSCCHHGGTSEQATYAVQLLLPPSQLT